MVGVSTEFVSRRNLPPERAAWRCGVDENEKGRHSILDNVAIVSRRRSSYYSAADLHLIATTQKGMWTVMVFCRDRPPAAAPSASHPEPVECTRAIPEKPSSRDDLCTRLHLPRFRFVRCIEQVR